MKTMLLKRLPWMIAILPMQLMTAEELPKPFAFARYQAMSDRSPFAVATAMSAPAETPNFAKDLYIANAAQSKEGIFVTVASTTDRNFKKYLSTLMAVDGYTISGVEWSDKVGATKVTVSKDGQSATLSFNEALLHGPVGPGQNPAQGQGAPPPGKVPDAKEGAAVAAAPQGAPGAPPTAQQPPATKPMPVPALPPSNAPHARGVIPRNPAPPASSGKPAPKS
jgi:hypothetical protein